MKQKHKYREKTATGFICTKYKCSFSNPEFCKMRAESNIDDTCRTCTGIEAVTATKHTSINFSTKSMNRKKAA